MAWHETWDLAAELVADPTSRVAAAIADWSHPLSHEGMALRDLYDLLAHANSGRKKPKPYPRPWDPKPKRYGGTSLPQAQVRAILKARGPQPPPDDQEVSRGD